MESGQVKKILIFCRDIDGEINLNRRVLRDFENEYYSNISGSIKESYINSKNKISKPTENIALNIPISVSEAVKQLHEQIEQLAELKAAVLLELNKLPLIQKRILYDFYISGVQWVQISEKVKYGVTQCKKIRNHALVNLAKYFSENDLIQNFNYHF